MNFSPITVFALSFIVSALAGLSDVLRGESPLEIRRTLAAMLWSGQTGLLVSLLLFWKFGVEPWGQPLLIGLALLVGMRGPTAFEHVWAAVVSHVGKLNGTKNGGLGGK